MWRLILLTLIAAFGFWQGKTKEAKPTPPAVFPLVEHKSFVVVVYAHNQALWCKRALQSIFEQDYPNYRVVVIDDGSIDGTAAAIQEFILANNQGDKVIFIQNEDQVGYQKSLCRVMEHCLDREIVIPMVAKDWFCSPLVFNQMNGAYQNPDVSVVKGWGIDYPTYKLNSEGPISYYAYLFKQIEEGANLKTQLLGEPFMFLNLATPHF